MKRLSLLIVLALIVATAIILSNCAGEIDSSTQKENETIENSLVTDPDGILFTIHGMPVTKAEFEKAYDKIIPEPYFGVYRAFTMHYLPYVVVQTEFKDEVELLKKNMEDLINRIKAGELTFEEAITEHSEDPGKDMNEGLMKDYGPGSMYYTIDLALHGLNEGDISEPIITPMGVMALKVEKIHKDYHGELVTMDFKQIILSLNQFLDEGQDIMELNEELTMGANVEVYDMSLAKEAPDFYFWNAPPETLQEEYEKLIEMEDPEIKWRDLPGDTIVAKVNDVEISVFELDKVSNALMPSKRDVYNVLIHRHFRERLGLGMIGYFKEYHEEIIAQLNDIKSRIESGELSFALAQEEFSTDPGTIEQSVYEGVERGSFVPQFEDIMFDIPLNTISEPFFSMFGGHILEVVGEELDEDGERVSVDVRHILIGFDQFAGDDENAMYQIRLQLQNDVDIKVYDTYIDSLLPNLGKKPEEMSAE